MIPWWIWSLVANFTIAIVEYLNRTGGYENFGVALLRTAPLILVAQCGLFYTWRDAPSFMFAWAFFTAGNVGLRVISSHYFVGEKITLLAGLGVSLIILGGHFVRMGIVKP